MRKLGRLRANYLELLKIIRFFIYAQRLHGAVLDLKDPIKEDPASFQFEPLQETPDMNKDNVDELDKINRKRRSRRSNRMEVKKPVMNSPRKVLSFPSIQMH